MGRIKRSWRLMVDSVRLAMKNPVLIIFPLLSIVASLALLGLLIYVCNACFGVRLSAPGVAFEDIRNKVGVFLVPLFFGAALVSSFIGIFCNATLIGCVLLQLEGRPHRILDGVRLMWQRRRAIFKWALFSCLVGLVIQLIGGQMRRVPFVGKAAAIGVNQLAGATWSVLTFLILPVLVFEEQPGVSSSLRRSGELFKRSWGEQIAGRASVLAAFWLVSLLAALPFSVIGAVIVAGCQSHNMAPILGALIAFVGILMFFSTSVLILLIPFGLLISEIYVAVLYSYAVTGMLPQEFSAELLPPSRRA